MTRLGWAAVVMLTCVAFQSPASGQDFDVAFGQCTEFAGIGPIPQAQARALVPASYSLKLEDDAALLVVRVVKCDSVTVDAGSTAPAPARIAQIGIQIEGGDASADINNYLLWFVTDLGELHGRLAASGIDSGVDQQLSFVFKPITTTTTTNALNGTLSIDVSAPQFPEYHMLGEVTPPVGAPDVSFVATWWSDGTRGTVSMRTAFPVIHFGGASLSLTPPPGSELAALIGSPTLVFSALNSYNEFDSAYMQTRLQ